ncbi:MAG TPA: metallophosphoesterase, partial [Fodinibius sp.]|nr:metallophosphoesterase [Fodinibius sp.]
MEKKTAHITDIHLDEQFPIVRGVDARENWSLILNDMSSRQIDEVIFGGDIGTSSSNKWFFDSLKRYAGNLKVTLGNHDSYPEVKKYYGKDDSESEGQLYYGYEDPFYAHFFLDSSPGAVSARQLEWLESALHAADKKTVIFIHHPILQVRT